MRSLSDMCKIGDSTSPSSLLDILQLSDTNELDSESETNELYICFILSVDCGTIFIIDFPYNSLMMNSGIGDFVGL